MASENERQPLLLEAREAIVITNDVIIRTPDQNSRAVRIVKKIWNTIFFVLNPLVMIVIGSIYADKCSVDNKIPIYLIVQGSAFLLVCVLSWKGWTKYQTLRYSLIVIMSVFLLVWFVLGTVWIYRVYVPNFDPSAEPYCNEVLYRCAFWMNTIYVVLMGSVFIVGLFFLILIICIKLLVSER